MHCIVYAIRYLGLSTLVFTVKSFVTEPVFLNIIDIDECVVDTDGCEQDCINSPGSFQCDCFEGFLLNEDNITCYGK